MTDESVLEWASGWLRENTPEDPTFRQRFLEGLASELKERRERITECVADAVKESEAVCASWMARAESERNDVIEWLLSEDARRYTEVGPLVAKAVSEGRHVGAASKVQGA